MSIGVFVVYIDTGSPMLYIPSKSRDLADENIFFLTETFSIKDRYQILVTVTQSVTNVPQTNNTSTSGMNEE
jgi:hypothetical protein